MNKLLLALLFVAVLSYSLAFRIGVESIKDYKSKDKCEELCQDKCEDKCKDKCEEKCDKKCDDKCDGKGKDCTCKRHEPSSRTCKEWDVYSCDVDRDAIYKELRSIKYSVTQIYEYLDEKW
jgi:hypothetical protein